MAGHGRAAAGCGAPSGACALAAVYDVYLQTDKKQAVVRAGGAALGRGLGRGGDRAKAASSPLIGEYARIEFTIEFVRLTVQYRLL